jgi:hypothetical protein
MSFLDAHYDVAVWVIAAAVSGLLAAAMATANGNTIRDALMLPPAVRAGSARSARDERDAWSCDAGLVGSVVRYYDLRGRPGERPSDRPAGESAFELQPRLRCALDGGRLTRVGGKRTLREARVLVGGARKEKLVRMAPDAPYDSRWMALVFQPQAVPVNLRTEEGAAGALVLSVDVVAAA